MWTVAVLGEVEVRQDGGRRHVPSGLTSDLLVRLALDAGLAVRTGRLLDDLWPDGTGRNTLQSKVSQLRRALGDPALVRHDGDTYCLAVDPGCVDAVQATELAAAASAARAAGQAAAALDRATRGLGLFRGEPLVGQGDWAAPHRARLEETWMGLLEDAMAARVDLGSGGELVGELEALVRQHPLRESLWCSLVLALYRAGRQADALAAYTRARAVLVEELGIEPGAELRRLELEVLRQSPALGLRPSRTVSAPGNLPSGGGPLVGRAEELAALRAVVPDHRLVTVVGPAGVGKTRLTVEAVRGLEAPGGVWLVRLDAADASTSLAGLVAETLHVPAGGAALTARLGGAETVLVLDSCEHVVDSVAALVDRLLDVVPGLLVLATSQVPLGVEAEHVVPLAPLSPGDSVALFAIRAREARSRFAVEQEPALVEEVCAALDGLPLAIELAASRVRSLSLRDIARRLGNRFAVLQDPSSHRPERRRALAGAIGWSYDLLFPDDQRGLWALSGFAGDAALDGVEHVLEALDVPGSAAADTVTRLVDRSLVSVDDGEDGSVRYRLLDSVRAYAADRLGDAGLADAAAAAHAEWYAARAEWCDAQVRGPGQAECMALARAERANVDAALDWCRAHDPALGTRIAVGFGWTWVVLGDGTAGAGRVRRALSGEAPEHLRTTGLLLAGWLEASAGDVAAAQADLDQAQRLATDLGDQLLLADVERHQAFVAIQEGRPHVAVAGAEAALATYRSQGLPWHGAGSLLLGAFGALMLGDTATAGRQAREAVATLTRLGDAWGLVHGQAMLGAVAQAEHRLDTAAQALERAADQAAALGFTGQAALHRATLARVLQRLGDPGAAAAYQRAIGEAVTGGDGRLAAGARLNLGRLLLGAGDRADAMALLEESERWYASAGGGDFALLARGVLAAARDDVPGLDEVLEAARSVANVEVQVLALDGLARLAAESGDPAAARSLLQESDGLAPQVAHVLDVSDRYDAAAARRRAEVA